MSLTKLKDIAFKLAYDHHEAESCQTADADKLALAIRVALEAERERCAEIAENFDITRGHCLGAGLLEVADQIRGA